MAFVMLAPSMSWPLTLACLFAFAIAIVVLAKETGARRMVAALLVSLCLAVASAKVSASPAPATTQVVISGEVCKAYPWLIECWCPICI